MLFIDEVYNTDKTTLDLMAEIMLEQSNVTVLNEDYPHWFACAFVYSRRERVD